ncbi:MAG TPA: 50S ribosomal protein L19e [Methanomicrobiales archaeon]|nr:50S ribosomal protein L19e [Methanomicrobiales archaeon]
MSDLAMQRRIAAEVLKCGENRIWMNPERKADIEGAISREDIRSLIQEGVIVAHQKRGVSRGRARERGLKKAYGHRVGPGSRKGAAGARSPSKRRWIQKVRAQRKALREMRGDGTIDTHQYRILYRKSAGGEFRSVAHLKAHVGTVTERRK